MNHQYNVGDTITYYPFGGTPSRTGVVIEKDPEITHGEPGFFLDTGVWGYDDQIISVERGMSPDTAAIHAALTRLSWAVGRIANTIPDDEVGTRLAVVEDVNAALDFIGQISLRA